MEGKGEDELEAQTSQQSLSRRSSSVGANSNNGSSGSSLVRKMSGKRIRDFVRGFTGSVVGGGNNNDHDEAVEDEGGAGADNLTGGAHGARVEPLEPTVEQGEKLKRVLYTANVGDARAVLW